MIEKFLRRPNNRNLRAYLIRTSGLFGAQGKNFVETMLALGKDKNRKELKVVADQYGKPTYTKDLAQRTRELIEGDYAPGVYHVTNEAGPEGVTWYDFAQEIFQQAEKYDPVYASVRVVSCGSDEFPSPAKRPPYSVLLNTKLPPSRPWQEALADYLSNRTWPH